MSEHRQRMMTAFKSRFVPAVRERGFVGAFPHFRRELRSASITSPSSSTAPAAASSSSWGGPGRLQRGPWAALPVEKITAAHLMSDRRRLTPRDLHGGWHGPEWFVFGPRSYDDDEPPKSQDHYDAIADQALKAFVEVGEARSLETGAPLPRPAVPRRGRSTTPRPSDGAGARFSPFAGLASLSPGTARTCASPAWSAPSIRRSTAGSIGAASSSHWPSSSSICRGRPPSARSSTGRLADAALFGSAALGRGRQPQVDQPLSRGVGAGRVPADRVLVAELRHVEEGGQGPRAYAWLERSEVDQAQAFILALRRDQLKVPGVATAADALLDAVAALLPGTKRIVFDRASNERRLLIAIRQNPLESTGAHRGPTPIPAPRSPCSPPNSSPGRRAPPSPDSARSVARFATAPEQPDAEEQKREDEAAPPPTIAADVVRADWPCQCARWNSLHSGKSCETPAPVAARRTQQRSNRTPARWELEVVASAEVPDEHAAGDDQGQDDAQDRAQMLSHATPPYARRRTCVRGFAGFSCPVPARSPAADAAAQSPRSVLHAQATEDTGGNCYATGPAYG